MEKFANDLDKLNKLSDDHSEWLASVGLDPENPIEPIRRMRIRAEQAAGLFGMAVMRRDGDPVKAEVLKHYAAKLGDCFLWLLAAVRASNINFDDVVVIAESKLRWNKTCDDPSKF